MGKSKSNIRDVWALLRKNAKLKARNASGTCCEIVLPVVLVLLIVIGFFLSKEEVFGDRNYAGELLDVGALAGSVFSSLGVSVSSSSSSVDLGSLYNYHGPTPVMNFDQFVAASEFTQAQTSGIGIDIAQLDSTFNGLLKLGRIALSPDTPEVDAYRRWMARTYSSWNRTYLATFATEEAAVDFAKEGNENLQLWSLIHFDSLSYPTSADFTLRFNYTSVPSTKRVFARFPKGLDAEYREYIYSGFMTLQQTVDDYLNNQPPTNSDTVRLSGVTNQSLIVSGQSFDQCNAGVSCYGSTGSVSASSICSSVCDALLPNATLSTSPEIDIPTPLTDSWMVPYPTAGYTENKFYNYAGPLMGMIICMSALYPVSQLTKSLVEEKETRMKELLKMMGLQDGALNAGWTITYGTVFFTVALIDAILLKLTAFSRTEFTLLLVWLLLFFGSLVTFSFFMSTFFSRAKLAAIVSPIALFATILPRYIFFRTDQAEAVNFKLLAALLSPTAFTFAADEMSKFEGANRGVTFETMFEDEGLNFGVILIILAVDTALFGVLSWYLDKVLPSQYGTRRVWYFCCLPSFWRGEGGGAGQLAGDSVEDVGVQPLVEAVPADWEVSVSIQGLRKVFDEGAKVAVQRLDLNMFEGQITALLGHNGAGKTTTISMISGLITPTAGDCHVYNHSILTKMDAIRQILGVCPQHDVLYAQLTVLEHFRLFGTLKAVDSDELEETAIQMINQVGLAEKTDVMAMSLSGGQKRKLSLGLSLIGSSRFVLCDEPTSGMDPYSRRATWELLRESKPNRTIVLTTHFMDEADLLGDRIAIMSHGALACVGSPLFLKKHYGIGYRLVLTKADLSCNEQQLHAFVTARMPDATRAKSAAGEMVWQLPFEAIGEFGEFFGELEEQKDALVVGGYGVSLTTLEECFIRIAENANDEDDDPEVVELNQVTMGHPPGYKLDPGPHPYPMAVVDVDHEELMISPLMKPDEIPMHLHSSIGGTPREPEDSNAPRRLPPVHPTKGDNAPDVVCEMPRSLECMTEPMTETSEASSTMSDTPILLSHARRCGGPVPVTPTVKPLDLRISCQPPSGAKLSPKVHPTPPVTAEYLEEQVSALDVKPEAPSALLQLVVQYRKRATVALRDPKAMFYEVVLPVILVFCVMLILNVEFNPAGPSMKLSPSLMGDYDDSQAFTLNGFKEANTASLLASSAEVPFEADPNPTSYWIGENKLLPEISAHDKRRYGSVVFGDYFKANNSLTFNDAALRTAGFSSVNSGGVQFDLGSGLPTTDITFRINSTTIAILNSTSLVATGTTFQVSDAQTFLDDNNINFNLTSLINSTVGSNTFTLRSSNISEVVTLAGVNNDFNVSFTQSALEALNPSVIQLLSGEAATVNYGVLTNLTIMFNATSPHSLPSYMAQAMESRLQANKGAGSFVVRSHPLPLTEYQSAVIKGLLSLFASLFLLVPFCYLPASYSMFVVKERVGMVKHVMLVSGQNLVTYWASNLLWDLTQYTMVMGSCMLVFLIFEGNVFTKDMEYVSGMLALLSLYGLASIPLAYCYSFLFKTHASSQIGIATINFVTGWVTVVAYYIMQGVENVQDINAKLDHIYTLFPPYILGRSLLTMSEQSFRTDVLGEEGGVFDWDVIGKYLFILLIQAIVLIPSVLIIEKFLMTRAADHLANCIGLLRMKLGCCEPAPEDVEEEEEEDQEQVVHGGVQMKSVSVEAPALDRDVLRESQHVLGGEAREDENTVLLIEDLCKIYPPRGNQRSKVAVDHLSVAVKRGSCFGLLGINGAGKSTTMAMLTGNVRPTSGDAYVNGHSIRNNMDEVRKDIGFCPQFDSLSESLTAYENLEMYAKIKGIPDGLVEEVAQRLVELVGLTKFAERQAGTYSGGNKRKLSLAIALIGNPSLVLLDEPSTGMDPVARRQMWLTIERTAATRSVVLTTHSMEECEALCDRVVVMVKGQFRCLGSIQHLKSRFGEGYTVELRIESSDGMADLEKFALEELHATLEENMDLWLKCSVPITELSLASIFGTIEEHKGRLGINDYSVSQTTLEQIFIRFARD